MVVIERPQRRAECRRKATTLVANARLKLRRDPHPAGYVELLQAAVDSHSLTITWRATV